VPRVIIVAALVPLILSVIAYGIYQAYLHYVWVYKPRVVAQGIVLDGFDEWMSLVPAEHQSTYEAIREFAAQSGHTPPVYYVIGIRMIGQAADGVIESQEARNAEMMLSALEQYDDVQSVVQYFIKMSEEPGMDDANQVFWRRGALPLKMNQL